MKILSLFWSFIKIGAFGFGGGYAMLPLIEKEVVVLNHWLTPQEFIDIVAISQMTPGPIAINSATFIGYRQAGVLGSLIATLGVVTMPFIIVLIVTRMLIKFKDSVVVDGIMSGIRPALIGLVAAATYSVGKTSLVDFKSGALAAAVLGVLVYTKVHPILVIVFAGIAGFVFF